MKLIHLGDLHLGKHVNGFSMMEDQRYILQQIHKLAEAEQADAVLIAGDVYDKPVPPIEAVHMLDDFLYALSERGIRTYYISGNHDSADRVAFGERFMDRSGIYISPVYDGSVKHEVFEDAHGPVHIWLIPFLRPSAVRAAWPEEEIEDYTDAMRVVIEHMELDPSARNICLSHQFVTGGSVMPETSDSEVLSVGGLDQVRAAVFEPFDYVALGHLHGPQRISRDEVRYSGSPLKYSFSELRQRKSVPVIELGEKGQVTIELHPLQPMRDLIELRGSFEELTVLPEDGKTREDYYHIILTDEQDVPEALARLRKYYPNIMLLDYDNTRTRSQQTVEALEPSEDRTPEEWFAKFYEQRNGQPMSEEQTEILQGLIREIWGEE